MNTLKAIGGGRSIMVAGAAAMVAAGNMLMVSAPASADNTCKYTSDRFIAHLSDGRHTVVGTKGSSISGMGNVYLTLDNPTGLDTTFGTASGGDISGYQFDFTVTPNYAGAKSEKYHGVINNEGGATGWIIGSNPQISWKSDNGVINCASGTSGGGGGGGTATVTDDVDVYSKPGGDDRFNMGFLSVGTQVSVAGGGKCPAEDWCHVTGPNVPNGDGYAWGAFFK